MKKALSVVILFTVVFLFVSCGDENIVADVDDNAAADDQSTNDNEQLDESVVQDEAVVIDEDEAEEIEDNEEVLADTEIPEEAEDDTEVSEEIPDEDTAEEGPDYSCNAATCATDADCPCDASWCVIDDDNVTYAGLTKLTCAKKDCTVGDDSTCPADYKCTEIPGFVLALMPELPKTVCAPK